jgi:hypothetical protein
VGGGCGGLGHGRGFSGFSGVAEVERGLKIRVCKTCPSPWPN